MYTIILVGDMTSSTIFLNGNIQFETKNIKKKVLKNHF